MPIVLARDAQRKLLGQSLVLELIKIFNLQFEILGFA